MFFLIIEIIFIGQSNLEKKVKRVEGVGLFPAPASRI